MRMTHEHYAEILKAFQYIVEHRRDDIDRVLAHYSEVCTNPRVALAWEMLRSGVQMGLLNRDYVVAVLYTYLNDAHITTGLLKALKEIGY